MTSTVLPSASLTLKVPSSAAGTERLWPTSSRLMKATFFCFLVPHAKVADLVALRVRQTLDFVRGPAVQILRLILRVDFFRPQTAAACRCAPSSGKSVNCRQKSASYQPLSISSLVTPNSTAVSDKSRPHRNPVVALRGRAVVFRRDIDQLATALHHFVEPMRLGHFVFDQVLADLDHQLGEPHVVEIHVGRLQSVHKRLARRLIAAPGVLVPIAAPRACSGGTPRT